MRKKIDGNLLKEELKRFKLISEYTFYTGNEKKIDEDDDSTPAPDELGSDADAVSKDLGVDDDSNANNPDDEVGPADVDTPPPTDDTSQTPPAAPMAPPAPVAPPVAPEGNDVDVDVTELVHSSEEAKIASKKASIKVSALLAKFNDLENRVEAMSSLSSKIDSLEKEVIERNPTPVEKLEMRSLNSYPYNLKLTDFWGKQEGPYDVMTNGGGKDKEYVLTQDMVDDGYSDSNIKKSFTPSPDTGEYEEEDI